MSEIYNCLLRPASGEGVTKVFFPRSQPNTASKFSTDRINHNRGTLTRFYHSTIGSPRLSSKALVSVKDYFDSTQKYVAPTSDTNSTTLA